ncbi:hypothetical protein ACQSIZ_004276, partial [Escherichia coli]
MWESSLTTELLEHLAKKASHQRLAGKLQSLNDSSYNRRYRGILRCSKIQKCKQANNKQAQHLRN